MSKKIVCPNDFMVRRASLSLAMTQRGFTLFEMLIALAIMGMILVTISSFALKLLHAQARAEVASEITSQARFVIDRLTDAARHAEALNSGASTFDADPGVLSLDMQDDTLDPVVFSLTEDDGQLQISEAAGAAQLLTSNDVSMTNLVFHNLTSASDVGVIQMEFTLRSINTSAARAFTYEESFETTIRIPLTP